MNPDHERIRPHLLGDSWWIFGQCDPGQYKGFYGCEDCSVGCKTCSGKFLGFMGSTCDKCLDKQMTIVDDECQCPSSVQTSNDGKSCCSANCSECETLRNGRNGRKQKCKACSNGFTPQNDECVCFGSEALGVCTPCSSGTYFSGLACVSCSDATPNCSTCDL